MENATLLVYLWSIYENVLELLEIVVLLSIIFSIIGVVYALMEQGSLPKWTKIPIIVLAIAGTIQVFLPKKEMLPYIFAASPVAKAITESATDENGKLNKVNKLIDLSLDKAVEEVQKSLKNK